MKFKMKMAALISALIILGGVSLILQSRQLVAAEKLRLELEKRNSTLLSSIRKTTMDLQSARHRQAQSQPLGPVPADSATFIPVRGDVVVATLESMQEPDSHPWEFGSTIKLSERAADLMGLTTEETAKVESVLSQVESQVNDINRAGMKQVAFDQLPDSERRDFDANTSSPNGQPGQITCYQIPALSDDQRKSLSSWLEQSLKSALGDGRADVIDQVALAENIWLDPGMNHITVGFRDIPSPDGSGTMTEWRSITDTQNYNSSTGYASDEKIPPEWAYLFKEEPAAPASSSP